MLRAHVTMPASPRVARCWRIGVIVNFMENQMNSVRSVAMNSHPPLLLRYQKASSSEVNPMYSILSRSWGGVLVGDKEAGEARSAQRLALACRIEQWFPDKPVYGFVLGRPIETLA